MRCEVAHQPRIERGQVRGGTSVSGDCRPAPPMHRAARTTGRRHVVFVRMRLCEWALRGPKPTRSIPTGGRGHAPTVTPPLWGGAQAALELTQRAQELNVLVGRFTY